MMDGLFENSNRQKNAHEDTTYIHIHGKNSVVHKQFTMIVNGSTSLSYLRWEYGEGVHSTD